MGRKFKHWKSRSSETTSSPPTSVEAIFQRLLSNRSFVPIEKLDYGDHGLESVIQVVSNAIRNKRRIALYADYDVDGTMSCVSWIWYLKALGYDNFVHYIPCRFKEGYGVNLSAVTNLVEIQGAELIITMDTGITANAEAEYCKSKGVDFICTDHHKIQPEKMPDCTILNPKMHPDPAYQELCGCGITFVLLRRLAVEFPVPAVLWTDLLALAGMATICDVVPLNRVNHRLARLGVEGLLKSQRPIIKRLLRAASLAGNADEKDIGFRLGPRINAVGRLGHADRVIEAFVTEYPDVLIDHMGKCNDERKKIQAKIVIEAKRQALECDSDPILFLGHADWHPGVVGIAASKIAETFWKPTWLFQKAEGKGKGSARSIPGFDVTDAMQGMSEAFLKFGGHRAAGGYTFDLTKEAEIRKGLNEAASKVRAANPTQWESVADYDLELDPALLDLALIDKLDDLRPFGHGFEEPRFCLTTPILGVNYYMDKTTGEKRHTAVLTPAPRGGTQKIMFFNEVFEDLEHATQGRFLVTLSRNTYQGRTSVSLFGHDYEVS